MIQGKSVTALFLCYLHSVVKPDTASLAIFTIQAWDDQASPVTVSKAPVAQLIDKGTIKC